jgi:hypothetical protein
VTTSPVVRAAVYAASSGGYSGVAISALRSQLQEAHTRVLNAAYDGGVPGPVMVVPCPSCLETALGVRECSGAPK